MLHKALALSALLLVLGVIVACGDDDDEATPTPSVCDQADALRESVESLTSLDVIASGTDALTAALDDVRTDLDALASTAADAIAPEVSDLQSAVSDAQDTLGGINDDSTLNERIDAVQSAITGIATAWSSLRDALADERC